MAPSVAVVGGGLCGCAAAEALLAGGAEVSLLDMGRSGIGGRTSVRRSWLSAEGGAEASAPAAGALPAAFEHGCQFLAVRGEGGAAAAEPPGGEALRRALARAGAQRWPVAGSKRLGWLAKGAFLPLGDPRAEGLSADFFGACSGELELHAAPGLCEKLVAAAAEQHPGRFRLLAGVRVTGLLRTEGGGWELQADGLDHERPAEELRSSAGGTVEQRFDSVIFTDHMAFLPDWHPLHVRGLAAAAPRLTAVVWDALGWDGEARRFRRIASLFTCMLAFEPGRGLGDALPFDAACVAGSAVLQWLCRQRSKFQEGDTSAECWVLVSTEAFAESCLRGEPMSERREDGEVWYRPQTDEYLRGDPAAEMVRAFHAAVGPLLAGAEFAHPLFVRCQRWGAAYPLEREEGQTSPCYVARTYDGETAAGLFAAGDWARPAPPLHAQAAYASGLAVAAAVLSRDAEDEADAKRSRIS